MTLVQLRCFVEVTRTLHFGKAAQNLDMMPATLGRHIKLLEGSLGIRLFERSTRTVILTSMGQDFLSESRALLDRADSIVKKYRQMSRSKSYDLKIGAIDTFSIGKLPSIVSEYKKKGNLENIQIIEDKTKRLLPRLLSGSLDLVFIRPPSTISPSIQVEFLCYEKTIVAIPISNPLSNKNAITVNDLINQPMIVPDLKSRPHSYHLTMDLFVQSGIKPNIIQVANEKQTIINLVSKNIGIALIPESSILDSMETIKFIPLLDNNLNKGLPLAAAWLKGTNDPIRDKILEIYYTLFNNEK